MPPTSKKKKNSGKKKVSNAEKVKKSRQSERVRKQKKPRKSYDSEALQKAIAAVRHGESIRKVSERWNVPSSTLHRYSKNPTRVHKKSGPATVLPESDEKRIVEWILQRSRVGLPVTKEELCECVKQYVIDKGLKNPFPTGRPGRKWYKGFMTRHPNLSIRKAQNITTIRLQANQERLSEWCNGCQEYLVEKRLLNIPAKRIFNCDESSMVFNPKLDKVIAEKGAPTVYQAIEGNEKENLTVLFMYNAEGERAPPMIVYPGKDVPPEVLENLPEGCSHWGLGSSDNGWMTIEDFYEYMTNVFYPWLKQQEYEFPIVVYMDGHSSHFPLPLLEFCQEHQIELIPLLPNSTQVLQPLDFSFFHPLKQHWKKSLPLWKKESGNTRVTKKNFASALLHALDTLENEKSIVISGFRATGLQPWNPQAVNYNILNKQKKSKTSQAVSTCESQALLPAPSAQENLGFEDFLKNHLDSSTLKQLMDCMSQGSWAVSLEKEAESVYQLKIEKTTDESVKDRPRVISDQVLLSNKYPLSLNDSGVFTIDVHKMQAVANTNASNTDGLAYVNDSTSLQDERMDLSIAETHEDSGFQDFQDLDLPSANNIKLPQTENPQIISDHVNDLPILEGTYNITEGMLLDYEGTACEEVLGKNTLKATGNDEIQPIPSVETVSKSRTIHTTQLSSRTSVELSPKNSIKRTDVEREVSPCREINLNVSGENNLSNSLNEFDENSGPSQMPVGNKENGGSPQKRKDEFHKIFTLPVEHLPEKKRKRLESSKKKEKAFVAATSTEFIKRKQEKFNEKKAKEEVMAKKRELMAQKKALQDQIKKLQLSIKKEKP